MSINLAIWLNPSQWSDFGSNNLLEGDIPSELGQLININDLRLSNNQLTGSIPIEIGDLVNLDILWLNDNKA